MLLLMLEMGSGEEGKALEKGNVLVGIHCFDGVLV